MAKILCISSQTVYGPVGNAAAVPALQALGHEVLQIPTVLLSNHPGLGKPAGQSISVAMMDDMFSALHAIKAFEDLAAVMTGYFTSAAQVMTAAKQISLLKQHDTSLQVLVDPVIGDHGKLYVGEDVAVAIRDLLLPLATITTPNLFELTWLTGIDTVADAVIALAIPEIIVTSISADNDHIATQLHGGASSIQHLLARRANVPNGTGDFLAGCYLAQRLTNTADIAFDKAMQRVERAVLKSVGSPTLKLN